MRDLLQDVSLRTLLACLSDVAAISGLQVGGWLALRWYERAIAPHVVEKGTVCLTF